MKLQLLLLTLKPFYGYSYIYRSTPFVLIQNSYNWNKVFID